MLLPPDLEYWIIEAFGFIPKRYDPNLLATAFPGGSGAKVWIASDPHPVHTAYPGFDSHTDIGAGESFSFTFDKVGSWGYHNHLNSTVRGTVVVTE